ncbi:MAG: hypothetical protein PHU49_09915 [Syntrophorhabdaceae bacterium]|jgi:hypothetical protein|nr:hypothetical protein [Syntrophorhabdaceae bacterium]MDD5244321.1 hypothetical protein [Syntrophorhabdaceae bacterium]
MAKKLKLPKKRVEEILKRVEEEPTLADDYRIIKEIFEDAIRIGLVKIKK